MATSDQQRAVDAADALLKTNPNPPAVMKRILSIIIAVLSVSALATPAEAHDYHPGDRGYRGDGYRGERHHYHGGYEEARYCPPPRPVCPPRYYGRRPVCPPEYGYYRGPRYVRPGVRIEFGFNGYRGW